MRTYKIIEILNIGATRETRTRRVECFIVTFLIDDNCDSKYL